MPNPGRVRLAGSDRLVPQWLHLVAIISLLVAAGCAITIAVDVVRHPQHMGVMNVVWPVMALFAGPLGLWGYFTYGRLATHEQAQAAMDRGEEMPHKKLTPFPAMVGKGATHCGSGCTLGDIIAEWLVFFVPTILTWFGWHWLFTEKIFATWVVDYILAFAIGVAFQYFTIAPMRGLGLGKGLVAAIKADTLSLTAWQVGMYGFMAIAHFYLFGTLLGAKLATDTVEFWFMMQIAMIAGFLTSYPVNWWLLRAGIKEKM